MQELIRKLKNIIYKNRGLSIKCAGFLLCIAVLFVCASCGENVVLYDTETTECATIENDDTLSEDAVETEKAEKQQEIYVTGTDNEEAVLVVHLCGAVNNPGVYELSVDSRVIDGIIKAGGFREDACEDALNLAMTVSDGSKIYVPTVEEAKENATAGNGDGSIYIEVGDSSADESGGDGNKSGLININTAGPDKLVTLPGIGESRAASIIAYREEHGAFKKIEDIMQVSGIKEGAFAKIRDYITVN